jgi:hypothetical protein
VGAKYPKLRATVVFFEKNYSKETIPHWEKITQSDHPVLVWKDMPIFTYIPTFAFKVLN